MKKWYKSLSKEQIQRYVFIGLLVVVFAAFFISLSIANNYDKNKKDDQIEQPNDNNNNEENPDTGNNENEQPEPAPQKETMNMPINGEFKVARKFYDLEASSEDQELSVIKFGKRYFTSNGIAITTSTNQDFEVLASLSGEVISVDESPIYGVVVTLKHESGLYTEYGSLKESKVTVGTNVNQGDVIGVSGVCEYDSELPSHVYFKVMSDSKTYNPEIVMGQNIENILK